MEMLERCVRCGEIEGDGVEVLSSPLSILLMLRMGGVRQGFEEFGVAAGAATVFRRASVRSVEANREPERGVCRVGLLHEYFVLPEVAEVIVVDEPIVALRDVGELELDFMKFFVGPFVKVCPVQGVTDAELVEVAVRPAHRFLEDQMELV